MEKRKKHKYLEQALKQSKNKNKNKIPVSAFVDSLEMQSLKDLEKLENVKYNEKRSTNVYLEQHLKGFHFAVSLIQQHIKDIQQQYE